MTKYKPLERLLGQTFKDIYKHLSYLTEHSAKLYAHIARLNEITLSETKALLETTLSLTKLMVDLQDRVEKLENDRE